MGHLELLNALRRTGEDQVAAIRQAADTEVESVRLATAARHDKLRTEHERRLALACGACRHEIVAEAEREAAIVRLRAEHDLVLRLRDRAGACLEHMRNEDYETLFRQLASELPDATWGSIRVNPVDIGIASTLFPGVTIVADPAITGGLEADTVDGTLIVVNTLESRLDRGWPDLLPSIVAELRGRRA